MLSLLAIILRRRPHRDLRAGGIASKPGRADRLAFVGDGQLVVPGHRARVDGFGDCVEHVKLENRCQRQRFGGVGARHLRALAVGHLGDPVGVSRARTSPARRRRRPTLDRRALGVTTNRSTKVSSLVRSSMSCRDAVGRHAGAVWPARADVDVGDGVRPFPPHAVHHGADVVDLIWRGQRLDPDRADGPVGVEHVHDLLGAHALRGVGADPDAASPAFAAGVAVCAQPSSQGADQDGAAAIARRRARPA